MPLDWTGIIVERDFYSEHYLKSVVEEDLRAVFGRWTASGQGSLLEDIARVSEDWGSAKAQLDEIAEAEARTACQREWLSPLLIALGYDWQPDMRPAEDGTLIPIAGEIARANGHPELWLLEAVDLSNELADPLSLPVDPGDMMEDALTWEDMLTDYVFSGPEPLRWALLFHLGQLVLIDRTKWAERRLLRFHLDKLFTSRDATKLLTALASRQSICRKTAINLLVCLKENLEVLQVHLAPLDHPLMDLVITLARKPQRYHRCLGYCGGS